MHTSVEARVAHEAAAQRVPAHDGHDLVDRQAELAEKRLHVCETKISARQSSGVITRESIDSAVAEG